MKTHNLFLKNSIDFLFPLFSKATFLKVRNPVKIEVSQIPKNDDRFLNARNLTVPQNVFKFL